MNPWEQELAELRRRILALEEMVFRRHRVALVVKDVVTKWPGAFSAQQIDAAIAEFHPALHAEMKGYAVEQQLKRMQRDRKLRIIHHAAGQNPNIYERTEHFEAAVSRRFNKHHDYESGLRSIVRQALKELPEEFTLDDVRAWKEKHYPDVNIPHGSWSSTLYKLEQAGELDVVKKAARVSRKIYTRGAKQVLPDWSLLSDLKTAWADFRSQMKLGASNNWEEGFVASSAVRAEKAEGFPTIS